MEPMLNSEIRNTINQLTDTVSHLLTARVRNQLSERALQMLKEGRSQQDVLAALCPQVSRLLPGSPLLPVDDADEGIWHG